MPRFLSIVSALAAAVALLSYYFQGPLQHQLTILGLFRQPAQTFLPNEKTDLIFIEDTVNCEDLHYHEATHTIFTACEDTMETRLRWSPAMANFDDPSAPQRNGASLHVIDPLSRRLVLDGFSGTFASCGIEVISDPDASPKKPAVFIFAVNHAPNPDFPWKASLLKRLYATYIASVPKANSGIEVFHHVIGSQTAIHLRTISHPLIRTPNDIFAASPRSIYVSNDHAIREGPLRFFEDVVSLARWANVVHVDITDGLTATAGPIDPAAGIQVTVALDKIHNANGLGHGRTPDEVAVISGTSGLLYLCQVEQKVFLPEGTSRSAALHRREAIYTDSIIDNPAYFSDPYKHAAGGGSARDRSGFVVAGLARPLEIFEHMRDPNATDASMVWMVRPQSQQQGDAEVTLLFQDDGRRIRTASSALIVAIDPKVEGGDSHRKGWLYITGFQAASIIAVKIDL